MPNKSLIEYKPEKIKLFQTVGKVYSISQFAEHHLSVLQSHEQEVLSANLDIFPKETKIPNALITPWTRSEWLSKDTQPEIANRGGARSAYHPQWKINLKGCRPAEKKRSYGNMVWNFDSSKLESVSEAYGVLSAKDIMCEILAVAFMHQHDIANIQLPICVFEYDSGNQSHGFSLAISCKSDLRIENLVDIENIPYMPENRQIGFSGIDFDWYCQQKVDVLIKSHFGGGFRNYTNCNYGNEIVVIEDGKVVEIYLTDFDKFFLKKIPKIPDVEFLKKFYLTCFIELAESSTPIYCSPDKEDLDESERLEAAKDFMMLYVESGTHVLVQDQDLIKAIKIGATETTDLEFGKVAQTMLQKWSPLYREYRKSFFSQAKQLGWDLNLLEDIEKASIENYDYRCKILLNTTNWKREAIRRVFHYHRRHN